MVTNLDGVLTGEQLVVHRGGDGQIAEPAVPTDLSAAALPKRGWRMTGSREQQPKKEKTERRKKKKRIKGAPKLTQRGKHARQSPTNLA